MICMQIGTLIIFIWLSLDGLSYLSSPDLMELYVSNGDHSVRLISYEKKSGSTHENPEHQNVGTILFIWVTSGALYHVDRGRNPPPGSGVVY